MSIKWFISNKILVINETYSHIKYILWFILNKILVINVIKYLFYIFTLNNILVINEAVIFNTYYAYRNCSKSERAAVRWFHTDYIHPPDIHTYNLIGTQ